MSKSSISQIELDEKKVMDALQKNARGSIDKIAVDCGFSRQKVWRVIKRLEENKTIWGYTAIVDEEKEGFKNFVLLVKRTTVPISEDIVERIISRKLEDLSSRANVEVITSRYSHGTYDWIISFRAEDIKKAKKFCEIFNNLYRKYVAGIDLLETLFFVRREGVLNPEPERLKEFL